MAIETQFVVLLKFPTCWIYYFGIVLASDVTAASEKLFIAVATNTGKITAIFIDNYH